MEVKACAHAAQRAKHLLQAKSVYVRAYLRRSSVFSGDWLLEAIPRKFMPITILLLKYRRPKDEFERAGERFSDKHNCGNECARGEDIIMHYEDSSLHLQTMKFGHVGQRFRGALKYAFRR